MNTYLIPIYDGEDTYIDSVKARNLEQAKDRIIDSYLDEDDDVPADWDDFISIMADKGYGIGNFYELSEF